MVANLSKKFQRIPTHARYLLLITLSMLLFASQVQGANAYQDDANNPDAANQVLGLVNQWRIQNALTPLKANKTLEAMALAQARFIKPKIASIDPSDDASYHRDAQGKMPPQRAIIAPYNWPLYGKNRSAQVEIGENAAVNGPTGAVDFWKSSAIHSKAALNPAYREVGVAAIRHPYGYVIIMDFGARPNVFPAMTNPDGDTLYLTNERSNYSSLSAASTQFRVFDTDGNPLTDSMHWQATISLPKLPSAQVYVLYTNGTFQSLVPINLATDLVMLPSNRSAVSVVTPLATSTLRPTFAAPTATEIPTIMPTNTEAPNVELPTATSAPLVSAPTTTPLSTSGSPDLLLTYSSRSLFILNNRTKPVNLTGLSFGGSSSRIAIETFAAISVFPISSFPAGHCLQVELAGTTESAPSACKYVRSIVNVSLPKLFWTQGTFTVMQNGATIATCEAAAGRCTVVIPAS